MAKSKKNPRKVPVSLADLNEARSFGVEFGIHISLWAAKEYAGMTDDQIQLMANGVHEISQHISDRRINYADIASALKEEYDLTVETRLIK